MAGLSLVTHSTYCSSSLHPASTSKGQGKGCDCTIPRPLRGRWGGGRELASATQWEWVPSLQQTCATPPPCEPSCVQSAPTKEM